MWFGNYFERTKEVLTRELPMSYAVYHIRNGTCKYPIFLHQNIEDKIVHASMSRKDIVQITA